MALLWLALSSAALGQEPGWRETGARFGIMDTSAGTFHQAEIYVVHSMRTRLTLGDWDAQAQWEISAARLEHHGIDGVVFTAGPVLVLRRDDQAWFLEAGSRPTLISEDDYGEKDLGGPLQFTSHGGIGWDFGDFELTYRFQHMSNARIYSLNDGLNLHMFELGWRFGD